MAEQSVFLLNLSDFNDRWNKLALEIRDNADDSCECSATSKDEQTNDDSDAGCDVARRRDKAPLAKP